jgi:aromatic-L-amino-acid decarboxylase
MSTPTVERTTTPLAIGRGEFRRLGYDLVDRIADFLDALPDRPLTRGESPEVIRGLLDADAPLPEAGADPAELLRTTADLLIEHSLFNGHPKFFGYITASPTPIGILGDFLASAVNPNVGGWTLSPMATEIEAQTVRWISDLVGFPRGGGLLVSGGNMANFVGFLAARAAAADWDVRAGGMTDGAARPLRTYASAETHTWIQKAADLAGLGTEAIRWIATDDGLRMDVSALRVAIERDRHAGNVPMLVIGTAGSVSTGAVDPLFDIAEVCREQGIWFHVDGAYGGFAVAVPGTPHDLEGLRLADSVALDPHKWLYAPLEAGCTLVRDPETLRRAFSYHPPYYHFGVEATNYVDFGPQNSRGFRALKVWLALRQAGRQGYMQMLGDDIRLTEQLYALVDSHPEFEAFTRELSIATFRYVPADLDAALGSAAREEYLNRLNEELLDRIQRSGEAFVSHAVIDGRYVLRTCIVNLNTRVEDIEALPEIIVRLGRETHAELGGTEG